jgi:hypothetical protein
MGVSGGPKSYPDGLVYLVDPANTNSYSGIGNTIFNIVNSSLGGSLLGGASIEPSNTRTIYFNNSSAYVNGPANIALTNNFTVSVWFKINVYNTGAIIGKWYADNSNNHRCWIINTDVPTSSMAIVLSSDGTYTNPTIKRYLLPVSLNEYTNITFTFASGTLLVYKNGSVISPTKSIDGSFSSVYDNATRPIQLGYFFDFSNYYNLCNVGLVKIYNRVLTSTEILQNYNSSRKQYYPEENIIADSLVLDIDPSNPRSYSGTGVTISDLSGIGNTGILTNGPTFSSLNSGSIVLDGTNDYITFGDKLDMGTDNFSFTAWFKLNSLSGYQTIFSKSTGTNVDNRYALYLNNNKLQTFMQGNQGATGPDVDITSAVTLVKNKWYFICAVYERANTLKLYVDGYLDSSGTISQWQNVDIQNSTTFKLGAYANPGDSPTNFTNGNIAYFKAHKKALSSTEVLQNYNATKNRYIKVLPPISDALVLNLDAGSRASYVGVGTSWYDLSGNNLNGTLVNGPTFAGTGVSSSIVFDRSNDYVSVADNSLLNTFSAMTLEIIVKYTTTNDQIFVQKWNYAGSQGYTIELYLNEIAAACYTGSNYLRVSVSSYPVNNVYHMILTLSGTTQTLYINGLSVSSNSSGAAPSLSGTALTIGNRSNLSGTYLGGNVYLTKFYNRALTAAEVLQNFNAYRTRYGI